MPVVIDAELVFEFGQQIEGSHAECFRSVWTVPESLAYFDGHFPGQPVLPAVAIIDASVELIRQAQKLPQLTLKGVKSAKFMNPVIPGLEVEIECKRIVESEWSVEWRARTEPSSLHVVAKIVLLV